jgi:hypothetical protein
MISAVVLSPAFGTTKNKSKFSQLQGSVTSLVEFGSNKFKELPIVRRGWTSAPGFLRYVFSRSRTSEIIELRLSFLVINSFARLARPPSWPKPAHS